VNRAAALPAVLAFGRAVLSFVCVRFSALRAENRTQGVGNTTLPFDMSEVEGQAESVSNADHRLSCVANGGQWTMLLPSVVYRPSSVVHQF
jgi:hypothetical protein